MNNEELILQMLGKISDKLEEHDKHFESIDNHFESIDNRFESIDNRFESLETDVRHTRMLIEKQGAQRAAYRGTVRRYFLQSWSACVRSTSCATEYGHWKRSCVIIRYPSRNCARPNKSTKRQRKSCPLFYAVFPPVALRFFALCVQTGKISGHSVSCFKPYFLIRLNGQVGYSVITFQNVSRIRGMASIYRMRPGVRRAAWLALCAGGDKASSACLRVSTFMFEVSCDLFFFYL